MFLMRKINRLDPLLLLYPTIIYENFIFTLIPYLMQHNSNDKKSIFS